MSMPTCCWSCGAEYRRATRLYQNGYVSVYAPECSRADKHGRALEHVVEAEKALGRRIPDGAEVHHVDSDRANNRHENLVLLQDRAYHALIDQRTRAYRACGHADWGFCRYCKEYGPDLLRPRNYHKPCASAHFRKRKQGAAA